MSLGTIIKELKTLNLYAECTHCGEEFELSKATLFDGRGTFPASALKKRDELLGDLKTRLEELRKRKISAQVGAEKKAMEVGIGKILEKIIPAYRDFKVPISDCRPLFEPIDLLVFNGMSKSKVDSVTFMEIKTGKAQLAKHERMVRDAIKDKKVAFKEI
jgi:predicted Holliday junction resolvase-like endonuclease